MCLDRERTEAHGSHHEVLDNILYRFHLIYRYRILLEVEEVADEYRRVFLIDELRILLELSVVARAGGQLQGGNGLGIPGMLDAVLAIVELSEVWLDVALLFFRERVVVHAYGVFGYLLKANPADGGDVCAEIVLQQTL